ncbi:hypothetical protein N9W89_07175 [Hellea sp.]|nr:hypothetical protein [Hellea sp.]
MTIDMGTVRSLRKLDPAQIDPKAGRIAVFWPEAFSHANTPSVDFKVEKNDEVQIEGNAKLITDPKSASFVPNSRTDAGDLIVYALEPSQYDMAYKAQGILRDAKETAKLFGGPDWNVDWHRHFSFTVEREAYREYCDGTRKLDISVWVKVNSQMPFQRLVDEKGIDNFVSGQLKEECDNPETFLITRE